MSQYLTPQYIETKRREMTSEGIDPRDADRHIADFISRQDPSFTADYDYMKVKNPDGFTSLLDFRAYGTTNPTSRYTVPEPPEPQKGLFGQELGEQAPFSQTKGGSFAERLQGAIPKENSLIDKVTAPVRNVVGLGVMGLGKLTGQDVSQAPEVKKFGADLQKTGDVAPGLLGTAGSFVGPEGTAMGVAAGKFFQDRINEYLDPTSPRYNDKSFLRNVGLPAAEGVAAGVGDMIIRGASKKIMDKVTGKVSEKAVQELVQPKATSKIIQETAEKSPELVKKGGIITKGKLLPSTSEKILADTAKSIDGFGATDDVIQNLVKVDKAIGTESEALRSSLQTNVASLPRREISSAIAKAQKEAVSAFGNETTAVRQYQGIVNIWDKISKKFPGTNVGQWDARIAFDQELQRQFGKKVFDPTLEKPIHAAVKAIRESANEAIGKASTGAGKSFLPEIERLSHMFQIKENMATKIGADTLKSGVQKFISTPAGRIATGVAAGTAAGTTGLKLLSD